MKTLIPAPYADLTGPELEAAWDDLLAELDALPNREYARNREPGTAAHDLTAQLALISREAHRRGAELEIP